MNYLALGLFVVYLMIAFGLRTWLHVRATGDTAFRGLSGRPGSPEWFAGVLFAVALGAGLSAPFLGLAGLPPVSAVNTSALPVAGVILAVGGIGLTFVTQLAMGASWRIGVAEDDPTDLVTEGPFAVVRNPIFAAMAVTGTGLVLLAPNAVALAGLLLLVVALQLQVRVVEEPHLLAVHGSTYASYAQRTGRFIPGVGRLGATGTRTARPS